MKERKKKPKKKNKGVFADRIEVFFILLFVFALFLLDVNANLIASYGVETNVPVLMGRIVGATSMFWLGFLVAMVSFFVFSIRSVYRKSKLKKWDLFFSLIGGIGLGIILSGGLLLFAGADNLVIPFFIWSFTRLTYYHVGIGLEVLSVFYFALTK